MVGVNLHVECCCKEGCVVLIFCLFVVLVFIKGIFLLSFLITVTSEYIVVLTIRAAESYICRNAVNTAIHSE